MPSLWSLLCRRRRVRMMMIKKQACKARRCGSWLTDPLTEACASDCLPSLWSLLSRICGGGLGWGWWWWWRHQRHQWYFYLRSPTFFHFHPLSSTFVHFCPLLSTFVHFHPYSSTFLHFHPLSSRVSALVCFREWFWTLKPMSGTGFGLDASLLKSEVLRILVNKILVYIFIICVFTLSQKKLLEFLKTSCFFLTLLLWNAGLSSNPIINSAL